MVHAAKVYFHFLKISVASQMQYRVSVILQALGMFLVTGIEFIGMYALFSRFGNLAGWTLQEAALFYGIVNVTFAVSDAFTRGFDMLSSLVRMGDFDRYLLRPQSIVLQLLGFEFTLRRAGRFCQGLTVLLYGWISLRPDPAFLLLLFWAALCGICLFTGILIFQGAITFWTIETLEVMNIFTYGGVQTANYPLSIYGKAISRFFLFIVPLGMVTYLPVCTILGRAPFPGIPVSVGYVSPVAGILFLLLALRFWKLGIRHYTSTGS